MMRLDLATAEYIGARAQQQDLAAAIPFATGAVLVLADGLGGHESGADASRIVVETFREACAGGRFANPETRRQSLMETVDRANTRIAEGVNPAHGHRGMASTVVAAVVAQGELSWVSVGDSHLYIWRGGRLHKLNEDHSQAGLMVRSGQYHANDPEVLAVKSVLVSALTGRKLEIVDLPQKTFKVEPGDVLMLASDGLNTLPDEEIEGIVAEIRGQGAVKLSTTLLERVRGRRLERQDNTTVAIARVLEPPRPEAAEPNRRPLPTDPARKVDLESPSRPLASLDESEVRTERITPITAPISTDRTATPGEAANATPRQPPAPAVSADTSKAMASPPEPQPGAQAQKPAEAKPTEAPRPPEAPLRRATTQPREATASAMTANPARPPPASGAQSSELRKPAPPANGARVSQPRAPIAGANSRSDAPRALEVVDVEEASLPAPRARAALGKLPTSRTGLVRAVIGVLLIVLILAGVAIAALAALKPEWLSGIVPGFGTVEATSPNDAAPSAQPIETAPQPAQPVIVPAPAPVPAVRPAQEAPTRPDSPQPDATRDPATQPANNAAKTQPNDPASVRPAAPATDGKDISAPQTAPLAADPQLIEPQRPARPPVAKQKGPANAN